MAVGGGDLSKKGSNLQIIPDQYQGSGGLTDKTLQLDQSPLRVEKESNLDTIASLVQKIDKNCKTSILNQYESADKSNGASYRPQTILSPVFSNGEEEIELKPLRERPRTAQGRKERPPSSRKIISKNPSEKAKSLNQYYSLSRLNT